jgi:hypothetical protein
MLRSLILSRSESTVRMIARGFKDLEVELEHCSDYDNFLTRALETRFDAIVVDDDFEEAQAALVEIHGYATCSKAVRIVLAEHKIAMPAIFKTGSQIVLYKPLSPERVRQGLRAVRNLMSRERRRGTKRVPAMVPARISARHARLSVVQVLLADINEFGAAIRFERGDVPTTNGLNLEFALPGSSSRINCLAELVWQDFQGSGGLRFLDMPAFARQQLIEWLRQQKFARNSAAHA